ncbi:phage portal protein [Teichococcus aestuarii]|uniref:phage portal protein n=1 Tax=Teichococcus aestuarii TaxID=568898 RepID=UPI003623C6F0
MGLLQRLAAPFTGAASPARERVEPVLPPVRVADAEPASAGAEPAPALAAGPPDSNVHHPEQWLVSSFGRPSSSGRRVSESDVLTLPAAMQALRVLCGVFAMTPLHYYRETENGRERAKGDPLHALFHSSPNQVQTAFAFKELLLGDLLLTGNFGAYVSRNRLQVPTALSRVDPNSRRRPSTSTGARASRCSSTRRCPMAAGSALPAGICGMWPGWGAAWSG